MGTIPAQASDARNSLCPASTASFKVGDVASHAYNRHFESARAHKLTLLCESPPTNGPKIIFSISRLDVCFDVDAHLLHVFEETIWFGQMPHHVQAGMPHPIILH